MKKSQVRYLSSVKFLILSEIQESMKSANLVFIDKALGVKINDLRQEIIHQDAVEFGILDSKNQEKIGTLDFQDSTFSRNNKKERIVWKIYLNNSRHEKKAMQIANAIQKKSKNIRVIVYIS